MADILQTTFQMDFIEWKLFYFDSNYTEYYGPTDNTSSLV